MQRLTTRRLAGISGLTLAALIALPGAAVAGSGAFAQTGGMSATLPLLGTSLAVDITLDAAGHLSQVNLDPVGTFTATKLKSHAVTFETTDGVTNVKVRASGSKLAIKARTATLDNLLGSGTWSADVFGTKAKSSVAYTIGKAADGSPTVTIDSVSPATGIAATTVPGTARKKGAVARVDFAREGFVRHLVIRVSVRSGRTPSASLGITLSGRDRQKLAGTLASIAGDHTWTGQLCDGTGVTATFNVAADGTVTFVSATGAPATGRSLAGSPGRRHEHDGKRDDDSRDGGRTAGGSSFVSGALATFTGTRTRVAATVLTRPDGSYVFVIDGRGGRCGPGGTPQVNTPVAPNASKAHRNVPARNAVAGADTRSGSRHGRGHGRGNGHGRGGR